MPFVKLRDSDHGGCRWSDNVTVYALDLCETQETTYHNVVH